MPEGPELALILAAVRPVRGARAGRPRDRDRDAGPGQGSRRLSRRRGRVGWPAMTAPKRFPGRSEIAAVLKECEPLDAGGRLEEERRVAGRVIARREMGKLVFLDLVDRSGRIQLMCDTGRIGDLDVRLG